MVSSDVVSKCVVVHANAVSYFLYCVQRFSRRLIFSRPTGIGANPTFHLKSFSCNGGSFMASFIILNTDFKDFISSEPVHGLP